MNRLTAFAIALVPLALFAGASPAAAQEDVVGPSDTFDNVNFVLIFKGDKCPESVAGEIVICPELPEGERYRIPENLRESDDPANQPWAGRVESFRAVGDFGALSCNASGSGGWAGCTQQLIDQAYAERRGGQNVRAAQLIEEERQERLSSIDAEAAAEQARVEVIEREYEARLEAERDARAPGESTVLPTLLEGSENDTAEGGE